MNKTTEALIDEYLAKEKVIVKKSWEKVGMHLDGESEELKQLRLEYAKKIEESEAGHNTGGRHSPF